MSRNIGNYKYPPDNKLIAMAEHMTVTDGEVVETCDVTERQTHYLRGTGRVLLRVGERLQTRNGNELAYVVGNEIEGWVEQ